MIGGGSNVRSIISGSRHKLAWPSRLPVSCTLLQTSCKASNVEPPTKLSGLCKPKLESESRFGFLAIQNVGKQKKMEAIKCLVFYC